MKEYEKEKRKRIEENRAKLKELGIHELYSAIQNKDKNKKSGSKSKKKIIGDDDEFVPREEENEHTDSNEDENGYVPCEFFNV